VVEDQKGQLVEMAQRLDAGQEVMAKAQLAELYEGGERRDIAEPIVRKTEDFELVQTGQRGSRSAAQFDAGERGPGKCVRSGRSVMSHSQHLARGMLWLGSATAAAHVFDVMSSLVVLRLLSGEELGVATLALTITAFLEGFNALGINNVIIQRSRLSPEQISSAWWYVLVAALLMTAATVLGAPLLASLYGVLELEALIRFGALKLLFVSLASVPLSLLNRSLRFREVGVIMAAATAVSAMVGIGLAWTGAGAWAPVTANIAHGLCQLLGACLFGFYRPGRAFSWRLVAPMARDGVQVAGALGLAQLTRNVDYLVLGKLLSLQLLGTYRVAFDLAMSPSFVVLQVIHRASLPVYSRIFAEDGALGPAVARTLKTVALLLIPPLLIAAIGGPALTELLDKPHAGDIGLVIACLCVAAWLRALSQCTPALLIAAGRPTRALFQAASSAALLSAALLVALGVWPESDPLLVTAGAWVVSSALQLCVDFLLARPSSTLKTSEWLDAMFVPVGVAVVTAAAALAVHHLLQIDAPTLALAIDAASIVVVYVLILRYGLKIRPFEELRPKRAPS